MMIKSLLILVSILNFCPSPLQANDSSHLQTYIVHVEEPESRFASQSVDLESWYRSFLPMTIATTEADRRIVYLYSLVFKGFAARLSPQEVRAMEERDGFISARAERKLSLHTTRSPHFLGLQNNTGFWRESNYGRGVIIGVLDTGVSPEHPSFSDEGMPPPPEKWKGICEFNNTTCNNKIIGARYFRRDSGDSPIDDEGHGTHTAGTAAGNFVRNANLLGEANGTAVGIAPRAHLAIYRVCSPDCLESEILAAMDTAIEDGVHVLSLSLGGPPLPFYEDSIALGAFSAMQRNISVSCSAGNSGPSYYSVSNGAPWILTVGASTMDRNITATAVNGDDEKFDGQSAFQPKNFSQKHFPLVYSRMLNRNDSELPYCTPESLNRTNIRGTIVVCEMGLVGRVEKGRAVRDAGGEGMILINPPPYANMTLSDPHLIPATHVTYADGLNIIDYINSTRNPNATFLFKGTMIGDRRAPVVAAFSSRGPNLASPGILKPDIVGPGVNILAAWLPSATSAARPTWNIISGTSMSCPHLSGVAALLKSSHPDWSPAAIKSAIMTTADVVNRGGDPILDEEYLPADIFTTGAGHVNPARANDPGLVYDIHPDDYIPYLCGLGYTSRQVGVIAQRRVDCMAQPTISEAQLNYPSWSLNFGPRRPASQTYSRTVTNVGEPDSCYVVEIRAPRGVDVAVEPARLEFEEMYEKMEYNVTFRRTAAATGNTLVEGFLKWVSSKSSHSVRSRIAVIM